MKWCETMGNCISLNELRFFERALWFLHVSSGFQDPSPSRKKNAASVWVVFVRPRWLSSPMARPELESNWIQITSIWSFFPLLWFVKIMFLDAGRQWINHNQPYVCYKDPYDVWYLWSSWARSASGDAQNFMDFGFGISSCRRMWDDFSRFFSIENAGESNWI